MNREQDLIAENQALNLQCWRGGELCLLLNQGSAPATQLLTFLCCPHGVGLERLCFITESKCGTASGFITAIICRDGTPWSRGGISLANTSWEAALRIAARLKSRAVVSDEQRGEAGGAFGSCSGNRIYNGVMQRSGVGKISHYPLALFLGVQRWLFCSAAQPALSNDFLMLVSRYRTGPVSVALLWTGRNVATPQ